MSNLVAFGLITLTVISCVAIIKHRQGYTPATVLLVLYLVVGLAVLAMIGAFTAVLEFTTPGIQIVRFVFPVLLFALPIMALYLTQNRQYQIVTKKLVATVKQVASVVTFILVGLAGLSSYVNCYYLKLELDWRPRNQNLLTIVSNLCDAGYYAGYASFWQANVLTELSNGAVEVWCFGDPYDPHGNGTYDNIEDIYLWLQKTEHATKHPTGKVFLLFTVYENSNLTIPRKLAAAGGHQFYTDSYYVVYTCDSWDELNAIVG